MAFPDSTKPIVTCSASSCDGCPVSEKIHCHFRPQDLIHFLLISVPGFIIGGSALLSSGPWSLAMYIAIVIGFFGFLEIRVMCSHCPHYAEEGSTLTCWANHGSPKLWKYRPGPMSKAEVILFYGGLVVIWGVPLPFFLFTKTWFLLALYVLTNLAFITTLRFFFCSRCMNFACPLNTVNQAVREMFFKRNPSVSCYWGKGKTFDI